jgi:hypothetical protein
VPIAIYLVLNVICVNLHGCRAPIPRTQIYETDFFDDHGQLSKFANSCLLDYCSSFWSFRLQKSTTTTNISPFYLYSLCQSTERQASSMMNLGAFALCVVFSCWRALLVRIVNIRQALGSTVESSLRLRQLRERPDGHWSRRMDGSMVQPSLITFHGRVHSVLQFLSFPRSPQRSSAPISAIDVLSSIQFHFLFFLESVAVVPDSVSSRKRKVLP